jgi:hypothetical protein
MDKITVILVGAFSIVLAQAKSDYFLIADPAHYTVFNQYQQSMAAADKREILTWAPLRVESADQTLGDQITRAARCIYNGGTYFLLRDDDGGFSGETGKGPQTIKNGTPVDDTVTITEGGRVTVTSPSGGHARTLAKGVAVVRFFKSGARYYVREADGKGGFGWSAMEPGNAWRKLCSSRPAQVKPVDSGLPEMYCSRVEEKIASANASYKAFFDRFNQRSGDQKSVPSWRCEKTGTGMRCEISGAWKTGDQLSESTDALMQELENVLIGSGFGVKYNNDCLMIQKRIMVSQ